MQLQLVGVVDKAVQAHWSKFTGQQLEKWLNMLSVHDFVTSSRTEWPPLLAVERWIHAQDEDEGDRHRVSCRRKVRLFPLL